MVREFRCDLHIHTCLSPCADLDMYPSALVRKSITENVDIIGICDHNASENVQYVVQAAQCTPLVVFPGMEITSREEVHILALFEKTEPLSILQDIIYASLSGMNREELFGCQPIVNEDDEVEGFNERLLIGSTGLPLSSVVASIHNLHGLAIAAHIDRESFGILGQLGFVPPDISFDALEISSRTGVRQARKRYPELSAYPFIESSDAHFIDDIGRGITHACMEEATFAEFKLALAGEKGRSIRE